MGFMSYSKTYLNLCMQLFLLHLGNYFAYNWRALSWRSRQSLSLLNTYSSVFCLFLPLSYHSYVPTFDRGGFSDAHTFWPHSFLYKSFFWSWPFLFFVEWQYFEAAFYWGTGTNDIKVFVFVFVIEVRKSSGHLSRWTMNLHVECSLEAEHLQSSNINPMFP